MQVIGTEPQTNHIMKTSEDPVLLDPEVTTDRQVSPRPPHDHDHLDPLSGEPGAHPVGAGVGAVGGGAAGAAIGSIGGPIGAAVGLVAGAIVGGLAGKGVAEAIDPTDEDAYWRDNFSDRFYVHKDATYETYRPAYLTGYQGRAKNLGKTYEEAEPHLEQFYKENKGLSNLEWDQARHASKDAWERAGQSSQESPAPPKSEP